MALDLTAEDRAALDGQRGEALGLAMRIVTNVAEMSGAERLLDIKGAHIDGCLYHGLAGLDFAEKLARAGAQVAVPTTLNVSALDLLHPELVRLDAADAIHARALMDAYVAMGCRATWTCAPYQLAARPGIGEHVAWAESNAVVFANSVLGARTERYGDFLDICCAITGRAPAVGLHLDEGRRARAVFRLSMISGSLLSDTSAAAAIGHVIGTMSGTLVPAIVGLPADRSITEDHLKALGAAAASSGSVAMFHAVGITPEAPTLDAATGGMSVQLDVTLTTEDLRRARDELSTVEPGAAIGAVSVGTPHCSTTEFTQLAALVAGRRFAVPFYVNTGRDVLAEAELGGSAAVLRAAGASIVTDTCTYITPVIHDAGGPVMTNSGKWAWYAPGNLGLGVAFGTLEECVRSAEAGLVIRDSERWGAEGA